MTSPPLAPRETPLVSIVIPVFNGSRYVAEAIDSALAQSHENLEVIVVDDGSDDDGATAAICAEYGDQIRYFHKPNGGVASALNLGIAKMSGRYFSWLSHDDRYLPHKLRTQLEAMLAHPEPVVVFGDAIVIGADGRRRRQTDLGERWHPDSDARQLAIEGRLSGCTLLIPRVCFETCGVFDEARPTAQDVELWYRLGSRYKFVFCPNAQVESRVHAEQGSAIGWHSDEAALTLIDLFKRYTRDREAPPEPDRAAGVEYKFWRRHLKVGYPALRRFCARLQLAGRGRSHVAIVDGGRGATGRVADALVDAGFRTVEVVGRPLSLPDTAGGYFAHADLSARRGAEIVLLGFDDGRELDSLAEETDRVIGGEADAVIWPPSEEGGTRLVARAAVLQAALLRIADGDPEVLPQELAMVGAVVLCSATLLGPAATASASPATEPTEDAAADAAPRVVDRSTRRQSHATGVKEARPVLPISGIVPRIREESKPRAGTEWVRRVLSAPPFGPAIQGVAIGMHRFAPRAVSRRAVGGVEWIFCARGRVDAGWYMTQYPEVRAAGWHPSLHYLSRGWREGKDPSPGFSTALNAAFLPAPAYLNPLTRSSLAGRSFAMSPSDQARWQHDPRALAAEMMGGLNRASARNGEDEFADADTPAGARGMVVAGGAGKRRTRGPVLILSDGSDEAAAWSLALAEAMRRRATVWRATVRDGALCDVADAAGKPVDLQAARLVESSGRLAALGSAVDRVECIGSVGDFAGLLSAGPVSYGVLPLRPADIDTGMDVLRGATRLFAPSIHAKRIIDDRTNAESILMRPPDFGAAVRFPVSSLDVRPGEALRVLAVSGSPSSADGIVAVARSLWRERIEIVGTGPASPEAAIRRAVPWSRGVPLVELVGWQDPHLVWLHSDVEFCPPFALVDVLRMGRPTLISGAPVNWESLGGRARTWSMVGRDTSAIVALLAAIAAGSAPVPEVGRPREEDGPGRFRIEELLA